MGPPGAVLEELDRTREEALDGLRGFLRIPSVSTDPARAPDVRRAAEFLAEALRSAGLPTVEVHETGGHPVVYAEDLRAGGPTLLLYGHYDVQPAEPLELWETGAFEPTVRGGELYARGAADDKGQVWSHVWGVAAWLRAAGRLPARLKVLIEGEEEIGSPNLDRYVAENRARLAADAVVISDSPMLERGAPSLCYGLRGISYQEIFVTGAAGDLHSGSFGGAVANPAAALATILAGLRDERNRVAVPGFYDRVRPLSEAERRALAGLPFDEEAYRERLGVPALVGEEGFTTLERVWARPTLEVNGLLSGYTGEGAKTVLPARAMAKVSMRLVPDQDPDEIARLFAERVRALTPPGVRVEVRAHHGNRPFLAPVDHPAVRAAARAMARGFGREPVMIREGGSIPVAVTLAETLAAPVVLMGFGTPDENAHAPNEHLSLENFEGGARTAALFLEELANSRFRASGGGA